MQIFSQLRRWPSLLALTALTALSSTAIALAADLGTDAVLGSSAGTPTTVTVGSNGFDIKIWATGNLSDGKPGTASVVKTYNMATNGTVTPDTSSTGTLTFATGTNYSNNGCNTAAPSIAATSCPSGSFANPKVVQATLIVAAGTAANTTGTVVVSHDGSSGLDRDQTPDAGHVKVAGPTDSTPPAITPNAQGTLGSNGWYTSNVTVSWAVVDAESAISSSTGCTDPTTINADTAGTTLTCSATSTGGTASNSVTVKRDATAPSISSSAVKLTAGSPAYTAGTWTNQSVRVTFACTDGGSGTTSALTGGDVATEGANQSVTSSGTCVDAAGNQAAPSSLTFSPIKIDKTKPVITADTNGYTAGSWANSNVTVSFSCADSGSVQSGLAPGDDSVAGGATVSADTSQAGTDVGSTSTCTDLAGNVADPASVNVRIDTTRPTISSSAVKLDGAGQPAGTYTAGTWTNRDVEVTFACNDTGSGTTSLLTGDVVDTDGSDHVVASGGTCEDAAGNEASPTPAQFGPIKIDTTKPVIEADTAGYTSGEWTNQSVSVSFTCADEDGPVQSGFATDGNAVGGDTTLTGETTSAGTDVPASGTCTDQAGNAADPVSVNVKIDTTDPTIDGDAAPDANGMGWNNEDVTVTFTCDDPLSGLVSLCQGPVTLSDEGRGQAVSETAKDKAGNEASDTVGPINIDRTDPSTPTASPSSGQAPVDGWYKDSVTVSYGGSSDPALDDPREDATDKSGSGVGDYTDDQVFSTSGTHAYSGTATDNAGNESDAASGSVKVDANKPTVDITCPSGPLTVGTIAVAGWSASDGNESGLTGAASGTELLNTGSIGTRTATKTVNDKVGHSEVDSCSYTVVYGWDRFYRPIENLPTVNVSKAGSSVPVKFSLDGAPAPGSNTSGQGSESSVIADQYPRSYTMDCGTNPELLDPVDQTSTAGHSSLTYDAAADQWVYVWKTDKAWAGTCRQLVLKLADGTYRRANFKLTK